MELLWNKSFEKMDLKWPNFSIKSTFCTKRLFFSVLVILFALLTSCPRGCQALSGAADWAGTVMRRMESGDRGQTIAIIYRDTALTSYYHQEKNHELTELFIHLETLTMCIHFKIPSSRGFPDFTFAITVFSC